MKEDITTRFKGYNLQNNFIIISKRILHDDLAPGTVVESNDASVPVGSKVICDKKIGLGRDNQRGKALYVIKPSDIVMMKVKQSKPSDK